MNLNYCLEKFEFLLNENTKQKYMYLKYFDLVFGQVFLVWYSV